MDSTAKRRWFGALVLFAALAMLVGGETLLKEQLKGLAFVVYWLICMVCTGLAIVAAFLDLRALQRRTRQEHRDLVQTTIQDIESKAKGRARRPGPAGEQG